MNYNEYLMLKKQEIKYDDYCVYLKNKYGLVRGSYFQKEANRKKEGLFIHHIKEDVVENLSTKKIAMGNDENYQNAENLVYCDYLEHLFLHDLIWEIVVKHNNYAFRDYDIYGLKGAIKFIIPNVTDYYCGEKTPAINEAYFFRIKNDKDVYVDLLDKYFSNCFESLWHGKQNREKYLKVRCVENNMIFSNCDDAEKYLLKTSGKVRKRSVFYACENGYACKGLHWEYVGYEMKIGLFREIGRHIMIHSYIDKIDSYRQKMCKMFPELNKKYNQ